MESWNCSFGAVQLTIRADSKELMELIQRDAHPFFVPLPADAKATGPHLELTLASGGAEQIVMPDEAEPILLHPRDTPLYGSVWHEGGVKWIYNPHHPALFAVEENRASARYFDSTENGFIAYRLLIYPLLYRLSDAAGTLTMHASAVERDGKGYLLCGPKGAGKTTCSLSLGAVNRFGYLANDYTILQSRADGTPELLGPPEAIRVGAGTYQALDRWLESFPSHAVVHGKRMIHLRDLNGQLDLVRKAELAGIYLVHLVEQGSLSKEEVTAEDAERELTASAMEVDGYGIPQIWQVPAALPVDEVRRRLRDVISRTRVYRLTVPYAAVGDPVLAEMFES